MKVAVQSSMSSRTGILTKSSPSHPSRIEEGPVPGDDPVSWSRHIFVTALVLIAVHAVIPSTLSQGEPFSFKRLSDSCRLGQIV